MQNDYDWLGLANNILSWIKNYWGVFAFFLGILVTRYFYKQRIKNDKLKDQKLIVQEFLVIALELQTYILDSIQMYSHPIVRQVADSPNKRLTDLYDEKHHFLKKDQKKLIQSLFDRNNECWARRRNVQLYFPNDNHYLTDEEQQAIDDLQEFVGDYPLSEQIEAVRNYLKP